MKSKLMRTLVLLFVFSTYLSSNELLLFSKVYELALKNTNTIKSLNYKAKANKEELNQEYSKLYPQINFSSNYAKADYEYNPNYANLNHVRQGMFSSTITLKQSIYNADTFSKIAMEKSKGKLFEIDVDLKKEELAQSVFKVYLELLKSHNKIKLYQSNIEFTKSKLEVLTKRYEMNLANKIDLFQMEVEYSSALISLEKERKLLKINELKLTQFIGSDGYKLPTLEINTKTLENIDDIKKLLLYSDNLDGNLKVLRSQVSWQLSKEEIVNSFDAHLPRVDLQGSISRYNTDDPTSDTPYNNVKQVALVLNIPIYSGGMVSSMVTSSALLHKAATEDLIDAKKQAHIEYKEYLSAFNISVESITMYKNGLKSAELYVDAVEKGYEHGLKNTIDLNEANAKLYDMKYKYLDNLHSMIDSYVGLLIVSNSFENIYLLDKIIE